MRSESARTDLSLWLGMLGPPTVWIINFEILYARVLPACVSGTKLWLFVSSIICLALIAGCGVLVVAELRANGARKFMAQVGLMSAGLFALITIAQTIAVMIMDACLT